MKAAFRIKRKSDGTYYKGGRYSRFDHFGRLFSTYKKARGIAKLAYIWESGDFIIERVALSDEIEITPKLQALVEVESEINKLRQKLDDLEIIQNKLHKELMIGT